MQYTCHLLQGAILKYKEAHNNIGGAMKETEHSKKRKTKAELKAKIKSKYRSKDPHSELYSKEYHEVKYSKEHICPICGSRIDENGMCACGAGDS